MIETLIQQWFAGKSAEDVLELVRKFVPGFAMQVIPVEQLAEKERAGVDSVYAVQGAFQGNPFRALLMVGKRKNVQQAGKVLDGAASQTHPLHVPD